VQSNLSSFFVLPDSCPTHFHFCLLVFCLRSFTRSLELSSQTHGGFIYLLLAFFRNLRSYFYLFVLFGVSAHLLFPFSLTLLVPLLSTPVPRTPRNVAHLSHSPTSPSNRCHLFSIAGTPIPRFRSLTSCKENGISTSPLGRFLCAHYLISDCYSSSSTSVVRGLAVVPPCRGTKSTTLMGALGTTGRTAKHPCSNSDREWESFCWLNFMDGERKRLVSSTLYPRVLVRKPSSQIPICHVGYGEA
jgi:hypothetical protein